MIQSPRHFFSRNLHKTHYRLLRRKIIGKIQKKEGQKEKGREKKKGNKLEKNGQLKESTIFN